MNYAFISAFFFLLLSGTSVLAQPVTETFTWPEGKQMALSLSFDDARLSQPDTGIPFLNQYDVKATFYVVPSTMEQRLEGWKKAVESGHEIGNHSLKHPCTGNFAWSRQKALEDYTILEMQDELEACNERVKELLGVESEVFAYPCGQKYVGRGVGTKSYVPLIAQKFLSGRGWLDEAPNDPAFCDLAQLTGKEMDGKTFEELLPVLEQARQTGQWIVLAGHEMGEPNHPQTTSLEMLKQLIQYAQNPDNGIWLAPVGTIARYVQEQRNGGGK